MKTRNNQQYKRKKTRKQIYSVTLDIDLVIESLSLDDEKNFSRYVGKALEEYNKAKKCKS